MTTVPIELLQQMVAGLPPITITKSKQQPRSGFDLEQWVGNCGLDTDGPVDWQGGRRWTFRACPFNPEHRDRSAYIVQLANGAVAAGCHHNSCRGKDWHTLRDLVEPGWRDKHIDRGAWAPSLDAFTLQPPIPFDQFDLPGFPSQALPRRLRVFVEALATATQTPTDLAGMLIVSVVAAACAKKVRVSLKEGWSEPLNIFTATSLPPGSRKSSVFTAATRPLEMYEREEARRTGFEIERKRTARRIKENALKKIEQQAAAARGSDQDALITEAQILTTDLAGTNVEAPLQLLADDCTPETLCTLMRRQDGRIAVMSPEGDVFDLLSGRYSPHGIGNFGVFLMGHAGDNLRVDRSGRSEYVKQPGGCPIRS